MKKFRLFCLLALSFMGIGNAMAQYKVEATQYPSSTYTTKGYEFTLTEIAAALETDTAEISALYQASYGILGSNDGFFTLETSDGTSNYNCDPAPGFWLTAEGGLQNWGEAGTVWFTTLNIDTENDKLTIYVGQFPDALAVGDECNATFGLNVNGNKVTFDVKLTIVEKPETGVETHLSLLNILGTVEYDLTEEPRNNYNYNRITIDISKALEALGYADENAVAETLTDYLYMAWYDNENECKLDQLESKWTANSGFWTGTFYDENTGEETGELIENASWKIYIEAFDLNVAEKTLSANVGQQPNALKHGDKFWLPMYLINGTNAYIIQVNINIESETPPEEELPFAEKTKVGGEEVNLTSWPLGGYGNIAWSPDLEAIEALFKEGHSTLTLYSLADGDLSNNRTANADGYWYNADGEIVVFGSGQYIYIQPNGNKENFQILYIGQNPGSCNIGDKWTTYLYIVADNEYYEIKLNLSIIEKPLIDLSELEMVADETYEYQIIPSGEYGDGRGEMSTGINLPNLAEQLGVGSYTFLGEKYNEETETAYLTDEYNCDPHPAFWMKGNYVYDWGNANSYGIYFNSSVPSFTFIQLPNTCAVGDNFCSTFYLVNYDTNQYVRYTIYIEYVEEVVDYETVGAETVTLPLWDAENEDYIETPFDLTACYEALGCDQETFAEMGEWKVVNEKGKVTAEGYEDEMYGFWFDANGWPTDDEEQMTFSAEYLGADMSDCGEGCFRTSAFVEGTYTCRLVAQFDGKRYYFNITVTPDADAIDSVVADSKAVGTIYDVTGRTVNQPSKGLYIVNGKKVLIK